MTTRAFIGVDPGGTGAIACVDADGEFIDRIRNDATPRESFEFLRRLADRIPCQAALEKVASRPGQGVSSVFKFGRSYGLLEGLLVGAGIPYELVTPQKWQRALGCMTRGDKSITRIAAQRMWPDATITNREADAILIAEWMRREWHKRNGVSDGQ